jgi:predicted enzyme involved in methoxymalonyl-ACP biosynthesis
MLDAPGTIPLALRLRDKFGDQGIVAVLLARPSDPSTLVVDSFLVSCRALGRGVEDALWAEMMLRAHRQSIRRLEATYISTPKNGIVADLYDRLGLQRIGHDSSSTQYVLEPVAPVKSPSWITSKNGTHGE